MVTEGTPIPCYEEEEEERRGGRRERKRGEERQKEKKQVVGMAYCPFNIQVACDEHGLYNTCTCTYDQLYI